MAKPIKIEVDTFVKDGKFTKNVHQILEAMEMYEDKEVTFIVRRKYNKRSDSQNGYYWAVIVEHWVRIIRDEWGEIWTKEEMHAFLKSNLNFAEIVNEDTGEILLNPETQLPIRKPKSTTENTTVSQEEFHKACRDLAWNMFQYEIPLPDHKLKAQF
jgi:hypothetical protein